MKKVLIVTGVVLAVGAAGYFALRKKKRPAAAPPVTNGTGTGGNGSGPWATPPAGGDTGAAAAVNVYSKAGLTLRSEPKINDPFLWVIGGDLLKTIDAPGMFVGTKLSAVPDSNGAKNPATGNTYNWYLISVSPAYASVASTAYVREDYVTLK